MSSLIYSFFLVSALLLNFPCCKKKKNIFKKQEIANQNTKYDAFNSSSQPSIYRFTPIDTSRRANWKRLEGETQTSALPLSLDKMHTISRRWKNEEFQARGVGVGKRLRSRPGGGQNTLCAHACERKKKIENTPWWCYCIISCLFWHFDSYC